MAYQQSQPHLGATFVPGGFDDYYLPAPSPEVISPSPQRIMPEVPEQMQDNLAHLELEAKDQRQSVPNVQAYNQQGRHSQHSSYNNTPQRSPAHPTSSHNQSHDYNQYTKPVDVPNFSPFPRLVNPPPNVPPTDDEKEGILENARSPVLNSNDPEMQLAWAQDALAYVEAAMTHEQRVSATQPARPATPAVEHQLREDALNIVSFLAEQHHPKAEFLKGMWLEFGKFGMRMDKREAFRCYARSADKGYSRAEYRMGMQFEQSNDPVKALVHYQRGVDAGDSASLYRLGMMTLLGQVGQQQDYGKGVQLLKRAAATADENAPQGAYVLGMLQGRELPQITVPEVYLPYDEAQARENIQKAAYLGFAKAQLKMGQAYELCMLGCEFNPALSLHYNALAARQGEPEAEMAISKWFLCGFEGVFQKNEELAYVYAERAAQSGLPTAEFAMGYFNEIGMNVGVNIDKAVEWYEKAAQNGNKDAEGRIQNINKSQTLSRKDHENVAINRIKSQYGSRRGGRPERFRQEAAPPMPSIADEYSPSDYGTNSSADTPTAPGVPRITHTQSSPQDTMRPPPRSSSTAPYPMNDLPSIPAQSPMDRPSTATPYPADDRPLRMGNQPPGAAAFFRPDIRSASAAPAPVNRPSSAFQINPNIYDNDSRPGPGPGGRMASQPMPFRPHSTTADMQGRRTPPDQRQQGQGRIPSGGAPPPQQPLKLDIGYSAPQQQRQRPRPDMHGAPGPDNIGYVAPLQPKRPTGLQGKVVSPHGPNSPTPMPQSVHPPRTSSAHGGGGGLPVSPRPVTSQGRPGSKPTSPMPSPNKPGAGGPSGRPGAGKPSSAPAPAANKPPGKGPKTFDEMGVPKQKNDEDCIVM